MALGQNRCAALAEAGLLQPADVAQQAAQAQAIINGYGILASQNDVAPAYWGAYVAQAVVVSYANAYARASVLDNLCGFSFAATDNVATSPSFNRIVILPPAAEAMLFATANGIPPTGGVSVVNNRSPGGALRDQFSLSPSNGLADQNLDGHLCLRSLATGNKLSGAEEQRYERVQQGIRQVLADGRLGGIPTILIQAAATR